MNKLKLENLFITQELFDDESQMVLHLEQHSKKVVPGTLFICKGVHFKKEYLKEALERGAIGYISEEKYSLDEEVPHILVSDIRVAIPLLAEIYYNNPQKKLKIVGVGGTKGKTTTTYFVKSILDAYLKAQGKPLTGLISSITNYGGKNEEDATNTTPEALDLQAYLADAVEADLEYVVVEVSSQALKYHRTDRIEFDASIFLNIDEDHISPIEHSDFADYIQSKAKMFGQTKGLIVNWDTQEAEYIFERAKEADHFYSFSLDATEADYYAYELKTVDLESHFNIHSKTMNELFTLAMPGKYNVENALAAVAATDVLGIPVEYAVEALKVAKVPGRMRILSSADQKIIAIADFAHNRLSFKRLITAVKGVYPNYKVISIFGAPGGKALGRRKELGTVAGKYSDFVYITMDDPGPEDVEDISKEIAYYVEHEGTPFTYIENREEALQTAFENIKEKTLILAIGKGHETTMKIGNREVSIPSDEEVIKKCIREYDQNLE